MQVPWAEPLRAHRRRRRSSNTPPAMRWGLSSHCNTRKEVPPPPPPPRPPFCFPIFSRCCTPSFLFFFILAPAARTSASLAIGILLCFPGSFTAVQHRGDFGSVRPYFPFLLSCPTKGRLQLSAPRPFPSSSLTRLSVNVSSEQSLFPRPSSVCLCIYLSCSQAHCWSVGRPSVCLSMSGRTLDDWPSCSLCVQCVCARVCLPVCAFMCVCVCVCVCARVRAWV